MTTERPERDVRRLSTPRAAGLAGVLFAVLFGVAIALIHTALLSVTVIAVCKTVTEVRLNARDLRETQCYL